MIPVTAELRKKIRGDGENIAYRLGGNLYMFSAWNDSREGYSGVDIIKLKVVDL